MKMIFAAIGASARDTTMGALHSNKRYEEMNTGDFVLSYVSTGCVNTKNK